MVRTRMRRSLLPAGPGWTWVRLRVRTAGSALVVLGVLISMTEPLACFFHCAWMLRHPPASALIATHDHAAGTIAALDDAVLRSATGRSLDAQPCQMQPDSTPQGVHGASHDHARCLPPCAAPPTAPAWLLTPIKGRSRGERQVWPPPVPPPEGMALKLVHSMDTDRRPWHYFQDHTELLRRPI